MISKIGKKSSAYIGAYALVLVEHEDGGMSDDFVFLYDPAFMGQFTSSKIISTFGLFEIIVVISLIIGGCVIVYALAIYLIRVYRGYQNTNELIEEESHNKVDPKSDEF